MLFINLCFKILLKKFILVKRNCLKILIFAFFVVIYLFFYKKQNIFLSSVLTINENEKVLSETPQLNVVNTPSAPTTEFIFPETTKFQNKLNSKDLNKEILLFTAHIYIERILLSLGIKYKVSKQVSTETSIVIFENYEIYLKAKQDSNFKNVLVQNKIGIIVFNSKTNYVEEQVKECFLNENNFMKDFLYVTKFNKQRVAIGKNLKFNNSFRQLFYNETNFNSISVLKCEKIDSTIEDILFISKIDKLDHVFINFDNFDDVWLLKSLFIDSIRHLSKQSINFNLKRYVLVDIDDIFFKKINETEFNKLISLQNKLTKNYFNHDENPFKLNLGISGKFYDPNNTGDILLTSIYFILLSIFRKSC